MAFSPYSSELTIAFLFSGGAVTRPTSWTAHLYDDSGAELSDPAYTSRPVSFTVEDADANDRHEARSDAEITFPAFTEATTIASVVVKDQNENEIAVVPLATARGVDVGDVFSIPAGELVIKGE